jgi:hypothetical protein
MSAREFVSHLGVSSPLPTSALCEFAYVMQKCRQRHKTLLLVCCQLIGHML